MVENDLVLANQDNKFYEYNWKPNTQYTISFVGRNSTSNGRQRLYFEYTDGSSSEPITNNGTSFDYVSATSEVGKTIKNLKSYWGDSGSLIIKDAEIMIEEGTTATPYEPYIPSVKMLADEVFAQNESLEEQGLLNKFDGQYKVGFYESDGIYYYNPDWKSTNKPITCSSGDRLYVNLSTIPTYSRVVYFNDSGTFVGYEKIYGIQNAKLTVPNNATKCYVSFYPNTISVNSIYVNNDIEALKHIKCDPLEEQ